MHVYFCVYIYIYMCVCPLGYTWIKPQTRTMMNSKKESPCRTAGTWSACKEHPHKNDETLSVSKCIAQWVLHGFDWFFASWHAAWLNCSPTLKTRVPMRFGIQYCKYISIKQKAICWPMLLWATTLPRHTVIGTTSRGLRHERSTTQYLSIYLYIYLSIDGSIYLSIYPSIHPSIHPSIYLPVSLSLSSFSLS